MTTDTVQITDSHCHLDFADFDGEHDALLARAKEAGVTRMVTICTRLRNEPQVRALAEAHDPVFYSAGTHPMSAAEEPMASLDDLVAQLRYGTIGINAWGGTVFGMPGGTWGAFPGHTLAEVGSGLGIVHNALLLDPDHVERTVAEGPWRAHPPPLWYVGNRTAL